MTRLVDGEPRIRNRVQLRREIRPTSSASPALIHHGHDPHNQVSCQDLLLTPELRRKGDSTAVAQFGLFAMVERCEGCRVAGSTRVRRRGCVDTYAGESHSRG
jgi:hypothetical protein